MWVTKSSTTLENVERVEKLAALKSIRENIKTSAKITG
jgi:hypothetical protein